MYPSEIDRKKITYGGLETYSRVGVDYKLNIYIYKVSYGSSNLLISPDRVTLIGIGYNSLDIGEGVSKKIPRGHPYYPYEAAIEIGDKSMRKDLHTAYKIFYDTCADHVRRKITAGNTVPGYLHEEPSEYLRKMLGTEMILGIGDEDGDACIDVAMSYDTQFFNEKGKRLKFGKVSECKEIEVHPIFWIREVYFLPTAVRFIMVMVKATVYGLKFLLPEYEMEERVEPI